MNDMKSPASLTAKDLYRLSSHHPKSMIKNSIKAYPKKELYHTINNEPVAKIPELYYQLQGGGYKH